MLGYVLDPGGLLDGQVAIVGGAAIEIVVGPPAAGQKGLGLDPFPEDEGFGFQVHFGENGIGNLARVQHEVALPGARVESRVNQN